MRLLLCLLAAPLFAQAAYDGAGHGFFNRGEDYAQTLAEADGFLVDLGWIKK